MILRGTARVASTDLREEALAPPRDALRRRRWCWRWFRRRRGRGSRSRGRRLGAACSTTVVVRRAVLDEVPRLLAAAAHVARRWLGAAVPGLSTVVPGLSTVVRRAVLDEVARLFTAAANVIFRHWRRRRQRRAVLDEVPRLLAAAAHIVLRRRLPLVGVGADAGGTAVPGLEEVECADDGYSLAVQGDNPHAPRHR